MLFVKALYGSFLGGVIGAVIAEATTQQIGTPMPWAVLVAGVFGGVGTRLACRSDRTFSTGLIAAVVTILAISGVSYVMSSSASKTAKRSMEAIPVRTDLDERIVEEVEADSEAMTEDSSGDDVVQNEDGSAEESASSDTSETVDALEAESPRGDEVSREGGVSGGEGVPGEDADRLVDDDRPAEMEASTDAWGTKVQDRLTAEDASSPMRSNSVLLFYLLSGLVAFVLGSGNGSNETANNEAFSEASDQTNE
ncbi:membrane protein [Rhodopirellula sallentina]|uniref:Membrane protein n=1 Tax=Rhodopirellula sallentina SM41 TaxID=1263870 RepID=M5U925_9BACT|nr:membrane protein [Rhodopirellula sallentina]EMI52478.1 membrane protein [Rhodopirellula sallentina SM41]